MKIIYPKKTTKEIDEICAKYTNEINNISDKIRKERENLYNQNIQAEKKSDKISVISSIIMFLIVCMIFFPIIYNKDLKEILDRFGKGAFIATSIIFGLVFALICSVIGIIIDPIIEAILKAKIQDDNLKSLNNELNEYLSNLPEGYKGTRINKKDFNIFDISYQISYNNYKNIKKLEKIKEICGITGDVITKYNKEDDIIIYIPNDELQVAYNIKCNVEQVYKDNKVLDFSEL